MKRIKLLIADDNERLRNELRSLLETQENLEVIGESGDGAEAVKMAETLQPDIIIMDISMPEMNGLAASEAIKKKFPFIKILIYSVHKEMEYFIHAYKIGINGYLLKDDSFGTLLKAIEWVTRGEKFFKPTIQSILKESEL
jgi:DNA-binding NarL/FixJ family response regulator